MIYEFTVYVNVEVKLNMHPLTATERFETVIKDLSMRGHILNQFISNITSQDQRTPDYLQD